MFMRSFALLIVGALLGLLAACGGQPPNGAVAPSAVPAPTGAPAPPAAPTQAPEATAAPELPTAPAPTELPAPTDLPPTAAALASATAAPATTQPGAPTAATPQPSGNGKEVLVTMQRSGGIAGIIEMITVYADGRLEFSGDVAKTQAQATPAELSALQQLIDSPEFAALGARYSAPGADLFTYEIGVPGSAKKIVTMDGAENPPVLNQLLANLQQLLRQAR
jgi:hypothetical protein